MVLVMVWVPPLAFIRLNATRQKPFGSHNGGPKMATGLVVALAIDETVMLWNPKNWPTCWALRRATQQQPLSTHQRRQRWRIHGVVPSQGDRPPRVQGDQRAAKHPKGRPSADGRRRNHLHAHSIKIPAPISAYLTLSVRITKSF